MKFNMDSLLPYRLFMEFLTVYRFDIFPWPLRSNSSFYYSGSKHWHFSPHAFDDTWD